MKPQILRDLRFLFSLVVACGPMGVPGAAWPVSWAGLRRGRWPASLMVLLVAPRVFRAPEVPAAVCAGGRRPAREIATRELRSEWSISRPALALPPPTGTAARPRHRPSISHVIPLRLVQTLNVRRWNCNVFGVSRKMTAINYVRNMGGGDVLAARGHRSQASCLEARTSPATAHRHCGRSLRRPPHQWGLVADVLLGALLRSQAGSRAATCSLSSVSHAIPWHLQFVT